MPKTFRTCLVLVSFFLVLTVASKKGGKNKGGGWNNRNPSYPGNTGSNWNPNYPGNTGSNWNPGSNYNPGGSNYNKQWKPPKSKTNMKMVAGAAAIGGVGGFLLGSAVSNMRYNFDNDMDNRYYNRYQNDMPRQVYRPVYENNAYVTEDRFVTDCYNMSLTEYVSKPTEGQNVSDVEIRVKSTVIRQLCVTEYRRGPVYPGHGLRLLVSPSFILFIALFVYFVVQ
ncbi:major prion protein [Mixophyes fleayi]|uniref:major prion protein n=1 Tax=Mixophyes fleayi TaxID=3061075 RepID=UPI003F4E20CB